MEQELDDIVYGLYDLEADEIKIVQESQPPNARIENTERPLPKGSRVTLGGVKYAIQLVQALLAETMDGLTWPRLVDAFTLATQPHLMAQEATSDDTLKVKAWAKRWNENLPPGALVTAIEQMGAANLAVRKSGSTWHVSLKAKPQQSSAEDVNYDAWLAMRILGPAPAIQLATPTLSVIGFDDWTNTIKALAA